MLGNVSECECECGKMCMLVNVNMNVNDVNVWKYEWKCVCKYVDGYVCVREYTTNNFNLYFFFEKKR